MHFVIALIVKSAALAADVEAVIGQPVGVGRIRVSLDNAELIERWQVGAVSVTDANDRLFWSSFDAPGFMYETRQRLSRRKTAEQINVYFLFDGSDPLQLKVAGGPAVTVAPEDRAPHHRRLLREWWHSFTKAEGNGDYAPLPEIYLSAMLKRRMPRLAPAKLISESRRTATRLAWSDLLDANADRRQYDFVAAAVGYGDRGPSLEELDERERAPLHTLEGDHSVKVEEAAQYVPGDAYYIRFGKFSNLLWLLELLEERAAELGRLVTLRSQRSVLGESIQDQLAIRELPFAEYLGDKLIADAVLVGHDFYFADGPAIGVLLKARNPMLAAGLGQLRKQVAKQAAADGAELTSWDLNGNRISQLSTPDNRIRSFHASRDGWHFITNSRAMVERFVGLDVGSNETLSRDAMFVETRRLQPADERAIDVFLGPAFLRRWASAPYQVESNRRRLAAAELMVVRLADATARHEAGRWPADLMELDQQPPTAELLALARAQLVPDAFGQRPDKSHPLRRDDNWLDSLRGRRGSFLPVPDVPISGCNESEKRAIQRLRVDVDPAFIRVHRPDATESSEERLELSAYLFPRNSGRIDWINIIAGAPTTQSLVTDADMWLNFEAVLTGLRLKNDEGNRHLLIGVLDRETAPCNDQLAMQNVATLALTAPIFRASWPGPGVLDGALRRRPPPEGIPYRGLLGKWRCQVGDVHLQSQQREVVEQVAPTLLPSINDQPAQVRFAVQDLQTARLSSWLESIAIKRNLQASANNLRALHELSLRFGLAPNEAQTLAADLYGGPLSCPLGGNLVHDIWPSGGSCFRNSVWRAGESGVQMAPNASTSPAVFRWFQGAEGQVQFGGELIEATASITLAK